MVVRFSFTLVPFPSLAALTSDNTLPCRVISPLRVDYTTVKNEQDAMALLNGMEYKYQTPLGGALS